MNGITCSNTITWKKRTERSDMGGSSFCENIIIPLNLCF
ncbi:hypothetical protein SLEP1_g7849 [Rubroshorea leprosula]|uniref:Uncharacterized protein n=1 Tax=Rubroshorea leprosula TaxID=152421 RepID=A0AAV5IAR0_9ROSI|nr:hypothetical protein SLEP1_g7849 [Rubroshorea leprosula]